MNQYRFFDSASTTKCCEAALRQIEKYSREDFGNPSSTHAFGEQALRPIREAKQFFARLFRIQANQVIFTGGGTESDNLAVCGTALAAVASQIRKTRHIPILPNLSQNQSQNHLPAPRILISATEHAAVRNAAESMRDFGVEVQEIPVDRKGQIIKDKYLALLTPETFLVSIQHVNNITGASLQIDELARLAKKQVPHAFFHTDAVQSLGKCDLPQLPSPIDFISLSGHKVEGPKGVGALIVLNPKLLNLHKLRPLIWGGAQENGFRSGTQSPGLIAGFHVATQEILKNQKANSLKILNLHQEFKNLLIQKELLSSDSMGSKTSVNSEVDRRVDCKVQWNSPDLRFAVPHIINLSIPGFPAGPLSKLLEEQGCLVSVGSACHSRKIEKDPVLDAMGLSLQLQKSAIRISLSRDLELKDMEVLANALEHSIQRMSHVWKN